MPSAPSGGWRSRFGGLTKLADEPETRKIQGGVFPLVAWPLSPRVGVGVAGAGRGGVTALAWLSRCAVVRAIAYVGSLPHRGMRSGARGVGCGELWCGRAVASRCPPERALEGRLGANRTGGRVRGTAPSALHRIAQWFRVVSEGCGFVPPGIRVSSPQFGHSPGV